MARVLRLDLRPPLYDSVAEASYEPPVPVEIDPTVELASWRAIAPSLASRRPSMAFIDGVQRIEMRCSAEGDGWPLPGLIGSVAAGAVCVEGVGDGGALPPPLGICHVQLQRTIIVGGGAAVEPVRLASAGGEAVYRPEACAAPDPAMLESALGDLRRTLEAAVIRAVREQGVGLAIVDGRLPDVRYDDPYGPVVGLIKTLQQLYVSDPDQLEVLLALRVGERSPLFTIRRRSTDYYSWFVCLATPGGGSISLGGLARLEMDDATPFDQVRAIADLTAAVLPHYASTPDRDARAPQNLLPVGRLERELRHQLGDLDYVRRLLLARFREAPPAWTRAA